LFTWIIYAPAVLSQNCALLVGNFTVIPKDSATALGEPAWTEQLWKSEPVKHKLKVVEK